MGKRAAATGTIQAWKRLRGAGTKSKVNTIVSVLKDSTLECQVPASARSMLAEGAPTCLSTAVEQRHKFQIEMFALIADTLNDMAKRLQGKVDEAKSEAAKLTAEQEAKKVELTGANQLLKEAKDAAAAKATEYEDAKSGREEVELAMASLESDGVTLQRRRDQIVKEQNKFTDIRDNMLKVLLEKGSEAGNNAKKLCEKLMKQISQLGGEPALQASAPSVLLKKPEERQGFDSHVLEAVEAVLQSRLDSIQKSLDEVDSEGKAREPDVATKREEVSQAKAKCEDLKSQLDAAEEVACDKEVAVVATNTLLEESEKTMQEMAQKIDAACAEVLAFEEVLAIFKDLEERSNVVSEKAVELVEHLVPAEAQTVS
mmetsp:Transcript_5069/g.8463  ORF Transcript_5069/g.8463 Transcript_5069/m.8463 type:complete len:372 (+) Transcript_5069:59-1174(+)